MNVLLIDNYDSFTFNLYQYLGELAKKVTVVRNSEIPFDQIKAGEFSHIVISPGPGNPTDPKYFGGCLAVIQEFHKNIPILGICLGHQGIGLAFGSVVELAPKVMHGKTSAFKHSGQGILKGLSEEITAMRYHSLAVNEKSLPPEMIVDARAEEGVIMAMHHKDYPTFGLQFHPESFATPEGKRMLQNFLDIC